MKSCVHKSCVQTTFAQELGNGLDPELDTDGLEEHLHKANCFCLYLLLGSLGAKGEGCPTTWLQKVHGTCPEKLRSGFESDLVALDGVEKSSFD